MIALVEFFSSHSELEGPWNISVATEYEQYPLLRPLLLLHINPLSTK